MKKIISAIIAGVMALSSVSALAVTSHSDDEFKGLASTERMKEYMKGTVALYIGSNLIAKDGETTVIDPRFCSICQVIGQIKNQPEYISELSLRITHNEIHLSVSGIPDGVKFAYGE